MTNPPAFSLTNHDLGDGCAFRVGRLPDELIWDHVMLDSLWQLHPHEKHVVMMHGRLVPTPRWQQAYGADYHYTGRVNQALPVPSELSPFLAWAQAEIYPALNGLLLNWYEGPNHYIGPHHDSTKNMVDDAPIVTASFEETRVFRLSRCAGDNKDVRDFPAPHGTIFVMPFNTNRIWKHGVPKSAKYTGRRVSVTIRAFLDDIDEPF